MGVKKGPFPRKHKSKSCLPSQPVPQFTVNRPDFKEREGLCSAKKD